MGFIACLILGVIGAALGGWVGSAAFGAGIDSFFDFSTWICAIGGALIVWGLITGRKRPARA